MAIPSDSRLSTLWSRAVIAKYKRCPVTGRTEGLQSHHVIPKGRQNRFSIRWNLRNGCPLAPEAHRALHDGDPVTVRKVLDYIERRGDLEYLSAIKNMMKHDFLSSIAMDEDEYRQSLKMEFEDEINRGT
jgi:hypothetical protein